MRFIRARVSRVEGTVKVAIVRLPKDIYKQHHPYPQDIYWLVEISNSTLEKDLKEKTITYARNGIIEAARSSVQVAFERRSGAFAPAVVDLPHKKVWVFTGPNLQGYSQTREFTSGNIIPSSFPNIAIAVDSLLLY